MAADKPRRCKDCASEGLTTKRAAPHPGPRCSSHHRAVLQSRRMSAREQRLIDTYDVDLDEYEAIKEAQGGKCAICQRATGAYKALAVDHDHRTGYDRGLLCSTCNKMLGHARDEIAFFERAIDYLENPPAFAVIGKRIAPIEVPNLNRNGQKPATGRKRKT
ncbi:endonuclease VII [Mycobacterium phage Michley]|nr:endonuclease VII [Mycobacterium phage Michley]